MKTGLITYLSQPEGTQPPNSINYGYAVVKIPGRMSWESFVEKSIKKVAENRGLKETDIIITSFTKL